MTTTTTTTTTTTPTRTANRVDVALRVLLALFFVVASGAPKLFGDPYAEQIFDQMGAPYWLRYGIGLAEVAGGIGLLVARFVRPAAAGLIVLMIGAAYTQVAILDQPMFVITPMILTALLAVVLRHHQRRAQRASAVGTTNAALS